MPVCAMVSVLKTPVHKGVRASNHRFKIEMLVRLMILPPVDIVSPIKDDEHQTR
jgi:hypothetical protein